MGVNKCPKCKSDSVVRNTRQRIKKREARDREEGLFGTWAKVPFYCQKCRHKFTREHLQSDAYVHESLINAVCEDQEENEALDEAIDKWIKKVAEGKDTPWEGLEPIYTNDSPPVMIGGTYSEYTRSIGRPVDQTYRYMRLCHPDESSESLDRWEHRMAERNRKRRKNKRRTADIKLEDVFIESQSHKRSRGDILIHLIHYSPPTKRKITQ